MDKTLVDFLGIEKGNGTTLTRKHNTSEYDTNPVSVQQSNELRSYSRSLLSYLS